MQFRATFIFAIATFTVLTAAAPVSQIDNVETIASKDAFGGVSDFKTLSYASFGWLFPDWTYFRSGVSLMRKPTDNLSPSPSPSSSHTLTYTTHHS
ncbi:hypothetical protein Agabi119p4_9960 [Agaricus bisporus var. burnettii]|uniref:Uncharacterized protein n=1 Tax=Agaricus bisporus var. burnettii TaxID=192524 RepID=A0A8H7C4E3_AGABI|nr:hypothetical protein Agabi119p4_9960 [Agaricus bisporus var. burnettii]